MSCLHDDAVRFRIEPASVEIGKCPLCGEDTEWSFHMEPAEARAPLEAEIERLRVALEIIADGTSYDPAGAIAVRPRNIARAALREEPTP